MIGQSFTLLSAIIGLGLAVSLVDALLARRAARVPVRREAPPPQSADDAS